MNEIISDNLENRKLRKTKVKMIDKNKIVNINNYELLKTNKYTVNELKDICRYYKLPLSGKNLGSKKSDLIERCYNYLQSYSNGIKINKIIKGYLVRRYFKMKKFTFENIYNCVNDTDFLSLEKIENIPHYQLYCFKEGIHIYGFDLLSLRNLVIKSKKENVINPYTRNKIDENVINEMRKIIDYTIVLGFPLEINIVDESKKLSKEEILRNRIYSVFEKIDELGNYTDANWLLNLNRLHKIRYLKELYEIWNYRLIITSDIKESICNPYNSPFSGLSLTSLILYEDIKILEYIVIVLERLVYNGIDESFKSLGAMYALTGLTLVSSSCAEALPWLYETARY